jgi:hypothetical protein
MTRRPPDLASPDGKRGTKSRPENYAATSAHRFTIIGLKERDRALEIEPGDRIVPHATQRQVGART